ncbi:hypothetical protein [Streptomyces sp. NPDC052042]|uniref:hypothetical protein n=1 Tax=Streptomyces sp. NPDC052042 TaxID=3365683 RepID=UPI0037D5E754
MVPPEFEFTLTNAVREALTAGTGLNPALESLPPAEQIHVITVCTAVMLQEAHGRQAALEFMAKSAADFIRQRLPRPYPCTDPVPEDCPQCRGRITDPTREQAAFRDLKVRELVVKIP